MTTDYMGMTPWEYNEWARSRENAQNYRYVQAGSGGTSTGGQTHGTPGSGTGGGGSTGGGGTQTPSTPTAPVDPYKDIDRSPFELGANDALALAQQQRVRDATAYRYNLAGLPQPIELWSGNVADTQRTTPVGTVASLIPGQGAFADAASLRAYSLAREAFMSDPIRAAALASTGGDAPLPGGQLPTGGGTGGWSGGGVGGSIPGGWGGAG
jgi:hypothetical protein